MKAGTLVVGRAKYMAVDHTVSSHNSCTEGLHCKSAIPTFSEASL